MAMLTIQLSWRRGFDQPQCLIEWILDSIAGALPAEPGAAEFAIWLREQTPGHGVGGLQLYELAPRDRRLFLAGLRAARQQGGAPREDFRPGDLEPWRAALAELEELAHLVERERAAAGAEFPVELSGPGWPARLLELEEPEIEQLAGGLRRADFGYPDVTDVHLERIGRLRGLRSLDLSRSAVTDAGLRHLRQLDSLRDLGLGGTQVTDAGLLELASLRFLTYVSVNPSRVTAAGLAQLPYLRRG